MAVVARSVTVVMMAIGCRGCKCSWHNCQCNARQRVVDIYVYIPNLYEFTLTTQSEHFHMASPF